MGKTNDEHLKRLNPTGVEWEDMTEDEQLALRQEWNKIVSEPKNLNCTCPRHGCFNNRNCKHCIALHRFYDGFADCFRRLEEAMQAHLPQKRKYNMHAKILAEGFPPGEYDPTEDPDITRKKLFERHQQMAKENPDAYKRPRGPGRWGEIVADPKNKVCDCPNTECWYHGNCVKCAALHRYYDGFPHCLRYIVDEIDIITENYDREQSTQS